MASMPMVRPEKTEYPVILATPIASEPPAYAFFLNPPMINMDKADLPYIRRPAMIMGNAMK